MILELTNTKSLGRNDTLTLFFFSREGNSRVGEGQSGNGYGRFVLEDYDYYDYITLYYELINSYIPSGKLT